MQYKILTTLDPNILEVNALLPVKGKERIASFIVKEEFLKSFDSGIFKEDDGDVLIAFQTPTSFLSHKDILERINKAQKELGRAIFQAERIATVARYVNSEKKGK